MEFDPHRKNSIVVNGVYCTMVADGSALLYSLEESNTMQHLKTPPKTCADSVRTSRYGGDTRQLPEESFDLAERESELVSRFNVEYRRWRFLLFFFSEILCLLTMSLIFSVLLVQQDNLIYLIFWVIIFVIRSLCIRAALPRFRLIDTQNFVWFRLTPAVIIIRILIHMF